MEVPKAKENGTLSTVVPTDGNAENLLLQLTQEAAKYDGLKEMSERASQRLQDYQTQPLFIMIVGSGNFGKSTLINALLGAEVAPVARIPKTWKVDVYHSSRDERAELTWRSRPGKTDRKTIAAAQDVCDKIEQEAKEKKRKAKKAGKSDATWQSDLVQVDWYSPCTWKMPAIAVVDTPGFNQLREDTDFSKFYLYGSEGIECEAREPFQYYYYRADIVLWCFKATQLEGHKSLEMLQKTKAQNKQIIGVVTHMDQIPTRRWDEIRNTANQLFGAYLDDLILMAAGAKDQGLKIRTTSELRKSITELLQSGSQSIKDKAVLEFLKDQEDEMVDEHFDPIIAMYLTNFHRQDKATTKYHKRCQSLQATSISEIEAAISRVRTQALGKLETLWMQAENDAGKFSKLVEQHALDLRSLERDWKNQQAAHQNELDLEWDTIFRTLQWESIRIGSQKAGNFQRKAQHHKPKKPNIRFNQKLVTGISADEGAGEAVVAGFAAGALAVAVAGPVGLLAAGIGFLAKGMFAKKNAIQKASEAIITQLSEIAQGSSQFISDTTENQLQTFHKEVNSSVNQHHGASNESVINRAIAYDNSLEKLRWHSKRFPTSLVPKGLLRAIPLRSTAYYLQFQHKDTRFQVDWNKSIDTQAYSLEKKLNDFLIKVQHQVFGEECYFIDPKQFASPNEWIKTVQDDWDYLTSDDTISNKLGISGGHWFLKLPLDRQTSRNPSQEQTPLVAHAREQHFRQSVDALVQKYQKAKQAILTYTGEAIAKRKLAIRMRALDEYSSKFQNSKISLKELDCLDQVAEQFETDWQKNVRFSSYFDALELPSHLLAAYLNCDNTDPDIAQAVLQLEENFMNEVRQEVQSPYLNTVKQMWCEHLDEVEAAVVAVKPDPLFIQSIEAHWESSENLWQNNTAQEDMDQVFSSVQLWPWIKENLEAEFVQPLRDIHKERYRNLKNQIFINARVLLTSLLATEKQKLQQALHQRKLDYAEQFLERPKTFQEPQWFKIVEDLSNGQIKNLESIIRSQISSSDQANGEPIKIPAPVKTKLDQFANEFSNTLSKEWKQECMPTLVKMGFLRQHPTLKLDLSNIKIEPDRTWRKGLLTTLRDRQSNISRSFAYMEIIYEPDSSSHWALKTLESHLEEAYEEFILQYPNVAIAQFGPVAELKNNYLKTAQYQAFNMKNLSSSHIVEAHQYYNATDELDTQLRIGTLFSLPILMVPQFGVLLTTTALAGLYFYLKAASNKILINIHSDALATCEKNLSSIWDHCQGKRLADTRQAYDLLFKPPSE
jgi:GTPase Era involved in 16S rRNA processing